MVWGNRSQAECVSSAGPEGEELVLPRKPSPREPRAERVTEVGMCGPWKSVPAS